MLGLNQHQDGRVVGLLKALGRAYLENGENQTAVEKFKPLYQSGTEDPEILINFALALARSEAIDAAALSVYRQAVETVVGNETLYLTLATLFLKENVTAEPALTVYRTALRFDPLFKEEIREAIEKVFHETAESITVPELRQALMDSIDNPELLSLYLSAAWQSGRFDEALYLLKDLYVQSKKPSLYLEAICQTLLEQKAHAEANGLQFRLTPANLRYCLRFRKIDAPISRIHEIDAYLDFLNLFTAYHQESPLLSSSNEEYEFLILDRGLDRFTEISETNKILMAISPNFDLRKDLVDKLHGVNRQNTGLPFHNNSELLAKVNCIAVFEITNFDENDENSKPPCRTFLKLMSGELASSQDMIVCQTSDGIITLGAGPNKACEAAIRTLQKLARYNQVVEDFETINLRITVHSSQAPFLNLEHEGLQEIRKGLKAHHITRNIQSAPDARVPETGRLYVTENVANSLTELPINKLSEVKLPYYPNKHRIFEVPLSSQTGNQKTTAAKDNFGRYEIIEAIKENQMYTTYRGYDPRLDRQVIIKAYRAQAFAGFKEYRLLRKQFYEEVRKLNRINHPNVGVIYDAGEDGETLYLVREFIEGKALNEHLLEQGLPEINRTLRYYILLCKVLSNFHKNQIWHKNLKPHNVFVTPQNDIKITDGGLLQVLHSDKLQSDDLDSQAYSSPEQLQRLRLTQSSDHFQLGVMLYESLTGVHPFRAPNPSEVRLKILADEPDLPSKFRHDIPRDLNQVIARSLTKIPHRRFQSIAEFSANLQRVSKKGDGAPFDLHLPDPLVP